MQEYIENEIINKKNNRLTAQEEILNVINLADRREKLIFVVL